MHMRLAVLLAFGFGCHRDLGPPPAATSADGDAAKTIEPSRDLAPLIARLQFEARHRAGSEPTAERALDVLDTAGLHVEARHQFVGATVRARYCLGGTTGDGLVVAVCEYDTVAAAEAGKQFMDERFAAMAPLAKRITHGSAVVTIADPDGVHQDALVSRALQQFAATPPHGK